MMRQITLGGVLAFLFVSTAFGQDEIRFGVLGLFHPKELLLEQAGVQVLSIHAADGRFALNGEPGRSRFLLRAVGDEVIAHGFPSSRFTVEARDGTPTRFRLSVPGKIQRIYQGKLTLLAHNGILTAIVAMSRESAVASIVAAEMPVGAPIEALKAQAVVTRSFLLAGPRHLDYDFCDTTHCQFLRSPDDVSARIELAVDATRGLMLAWHSQPVAALYSSRCGGQTRSLRDVGMDPHGAYSYYSVPCRWCREHPVHWQSRIQSSDPPPQPSNESTRIAYVRQWGWSTLPGSSFTARRDSVGVIIDGHSIGHSLGMCQFGAIGLASSGADFRSILAHYYPNTDIMSIPK